MGYIININIDGFQWKGEKEDGMVAFEAKYPELKFTQTSSHVLKAQYGNTWTEVPIGSWLCAPEGDISNLFALRYRVMHRVSDLRCKQYSVDYKPFQITFPDVEIVFHRDYSELELNRILQQVDESAYSELNKYRIHIHGRHVDVFPHHVLLLGPDYLFTWTGDFCTELVKNGNITVKKSQIIVEDESVVIVRSDSTIIVDETKDCQVCKRDLTGVPNEALMNDISENTHNLLQRMNSISYKFSVNDNKEANIVTLRFISDYAIKIAGGITPDGKMAILARVLEELTRLMKESALHKQDKVAWEIKIKNFTFNAIHTKSTQTITLIC